MRHPSGRGLQRDYRDLIKQAFNSEYWDESATTTDGIPLIEANFSLFWGLAVQIYEASLISDDSPLDRFIREERSRGNMESVVPRFIENSLSSALSAEQKLGMRIFFNDALIDPTIGAGIKDLIRDNTKIVYTESPGSLTFEVQDIPAIAAEAHKAGAVVIMDNTWSGGHFFKPFEHGVDVAVQAATKYIVGHSDAMLGTITTTEEHWRAVRTSVGQCAAPSGPDDVYLGLRGLRTLSVRMERHHQTGLKLANWLEARPEVKRVLHPGLPSNPSHELWKRDFTGASGLFGVVLNDYTDNAVSAMLDGLALYGMGASWGGFESLILPTRPAPFRSATEWTETPSLRIHAGLEDVDDLMEDLDKGFERLNASN